MTSASEYKPEVEIVSDSEKLARRSFEIFLTEAQKAISGKDIFHTAISGGRTPKRFFELLGESAESKTLPWNKVHLFWVDERHVSPDSQQSNFRLAADTFLKKVAVPEQNIHRVETEYRNVEAAAICYEQTIRQAFNLKENQIPRFDLIFLGLGTDGHIGSLFAGSSALFEKKKLVCVVRGLDGLNRITLTPAVLCAASCLVILVTGEEKADILKKVLTAKPEAIKYPVHTLWPVLDKVTWLIDLSAAKLL